MATKKDIGEIKAYISQINTAIADIRYPIIQALQKVGGHRHDIFLNDIFLSADIFL